MEEVKFGTILENACRLAGRNPSVMDVPADWKVLAGMAIESGLHALAAEKFPSMQRVEFRRYRPDWRSGIRYEPGQEVWYKEAYWKKESGDGGPPSQGGWKRLDMGEVAAFVAFDQPWEQVVMQSFGVDVTRFAYAADPRYNPLAPPLPCRLCELGVIVMGERGETPPDGVWVKFVPEYPKIGFEEWRAGTLYRAGDVAYTTSSKDIWQAVVDVPDAEIAQVAPENDTSDLWRPLRIRGEFASYLTRLAAADLLTEDQGKHQTRAAADREFELLCERYHEGNGETRIRRGRFC